MRRERVAWVLIALAGCASAGDPTTAPADSPPLTSVVDASRVIATTAPSSAVPEGFDQVAATAVAADGRVCELCLWLADTPQLRARGLMFVDALGPADGMLFRFPSPTDRGFWMKNTRLALSIAYFDAKGDFLEALDMQPCIEGSCPLYRIDEPYVDAVEVPIGALDGLGLGPGSRLEVHGRPCPPTSDQSVAVADSHAS